MKLLQYYLLCCLATTLTAQTNTEIHLFDIINDGNTTSLVNGKNISNNEGYDSQPQFLAKNVLIYAGTREGQTEIMQYTRGTTRVFNKTTSGSEYSPQFIVGKRGISAVRLDTTGLQRLYAYLPRKEETPVLIKDAVVAYFTWVDEQTIVSADIVDSELHLVVHNTSTAQSTDLAIAVGRSFHKIPNTNLVSFIDKTEDAWVVKSIDPSSLKIEEITVLIPGVEDIAWLPDGSLLAAKENTLFIKRKDAQWTSFYSFDDEDLKNISRFAIDSEGSQIAIVSEVSPGKTVDKHLKPFNDRNLNAFTNSFTEDVVVRNFFKDTLYTGRNALRDHYEAYFKKTTTSKVAVLNRIIKDNIVIDEEEVTGNGVTHKQATIYEVGNGKIASMTIIKDNPTAPNPVSTVDTQLKAYNEGNIAGFMDLYTDDIALYSYPYIPEITERSVITKTYGDMFTQLPDLEAVINNRIVIGNISIDHEKLNANGNTWYGVAINEVLNGKISRVTFL